MSKATEDRARDLLRRYWNGEGGLSDDLAAELASALAERDAARRRLKEMRSTSLNFQIERDDTRAEVERLRDLVKRAQLRIPPGYMSWHDEARAALAGGGRDA